MHVKTVCTNCGEICRTGSIKNFRHCGIEQNVKANLLAGEEEKFKKLVTKKTGKPSEAPQVPIVKKKEPIKEIFEEVEEKKNNTPVVEPIIEEKPGPEPPKKKVVKKRKKSVIVEEKPEVSTDFNFGFF